MRADEQLLQHLVHCASGGSGGRYSIEQNILTWTVNKNQQRQAGRTECYGPHFAKPQRWLLYHDSINFDFFL